MPVWPHHRPDETLIFGRFPCETISNKADFCDHPLPGFLLPFSSFDDFQHFCLSLSSNLWQGHLPFSLHKNIPCFYLENQCDFLISGSTPWAKPQIVDTYSLLFPLLFDHVGKHFCTRLTLSVQQVSWNCTLRSFVIILLLGVSLFVHFDAINKSDFVHISIKRSLKQQRSQTFSPFTLTSSSSGSSHCISVYGTVWPSNQSSSWLCGSAREPLCSPFSFSFHDDPGGSRAACGATRCARSEAIKQETDPLSASTPSDLDYSNLPFT